MIIGGVGEKDVHLVVQEPGFTATDKLFCAELGLEVVDNKAAFGMVDEDALIFGVHLYIRTWHEALPHLPAIFIGTGLESWQEVTRFKPELAPLLAPIATMHETYSHSPFPDLGHIFSSTCIYWKKNTPSTGTAPVP